MAGEGGGVEIECPLCHSQFSLEDGTAGKWCPKDGLLTGIIGTLKQKSERTNALVRFGEDHMNAIIFFCLSS